MRDITIRLRETRPAPAASEFFREAWRGSPSKYHYDSSPRSGEALESASR
jgi:hypothetical protein